MHDLRSVHHLLVQERALYESYKQYLTLLQPPLLQEKLQQSMEESGRHIQALQEALVKSGDQAGSPDSPNPTGPADLSAHSLLQYFYEAEEHLYYLYLNAFKAEEEGGLRALFELHLEDQKRHIAVIQNIYAESLYY